MEIVKKIIALVSSMRAGLFLLAAIGITSAIGSYFLPTTFYRSPTFQLLLLLLLINMAFCTAQQLIKAIKKAKSNANKGKTPSASTFRRSGLILLHAGLVFILVGGTINSFGGISETVPIIEGEGVEITRVIPEAKPFTLQMDEFIIEFNEDASPSQYISNVSIIENGEVTREYSISVNNPLEHNNIKIYQSSFGYLIDAEAKTENGLSERSLFQEGSVLNLQGTDIAVMLYRYLPDFDPASGMQTRSYRPDNPVIIYSVYEMGSLLNVGYASFGETVEIAENAFVTFHGVKPYTGLIIKRDPGLGVAAIGGIMLMLGACLALIFRTKNPEQRD